MFSARNIENFLVVSNGGAGMVGTERVPRLPRQAEGSLLHVRARTLGAHDLLVQPFGWSGDLR